MFLFEIIDESPHFEAWMAFYALWLVWVTGLAGFYFIADAALSNHRGVIGFVREMYGSVASGVILAWITGSLVSVSVAWPLLLLGPIMLVSLGGAPVSTAALCYCYAAAMGYLSIRMFARRFVSRDL